MMVTNLKEGTKKKCEQYWPNSGSKEFGPFKVTLTEQQVFADYMHYKDNASHCEFTRKRFVLAPRLLSVVEAFFRSLIGELHRTLSFLNLVSS